MKYHALTEEQIHSYYEQRLEAVEGELLTASQNAVLAEVTLASALEETRQKVVSLEQRRDALLNQWAYSTSLRNEKDEEADDGQG